MLSLWLLCSFSLSGEKEGDVIASQGKPDRQMLKKTFLTICLTEKARPWEQEKGLTLSPAPPLSPQLTKGVRDQDLWSHRRPTK